MNFFKITKFADFVCETLFGSQTLSMILLLHNIMLVMAKQERRHSLRIKKGSQPLSVDFLVLKI